MKLYSGMHFKMPDNGPLYYNTKNDHQLGVITIDIFNESDELIEKHKKHNNRSFYYIEKIDYQLGILTFNRLNENNELIEKSTCFYEIFKKYINKMGLIRDYKRERKQKLEKLKL